MTKIFGNKIVVVETKEETLFTTRLTVSVSKTVEGKVSLLSPTETCNFLREFIKEVESAIRKPHQ